MYIKFNYFIQRVKKKKDTLYIHFYDNKNIFI